MTLAEGIDHVAGAQALNLAKSRAFMLESDYWRRLGMEDRAEFCFLNAVECGQIAEAQEAVLEAARDVLSRKGGGP